MFFLPIILVAVCKQRWQSLRDCFRRVKRNRKRMKYMLSGSRVLKKWKYEDEMEFLLPFLVDRSARNNGNDKYVSMEPIGTENIDIKQDLEESSDCDIQYTNENPLNTNPKRHSWNIFPAELNAEVNRPMEQSETFHLHQENKQAHTEHDDLDKFFLCMSAMVKQFPPFKQATAKNKVFMLVSEMELQHFSNTCQTSAVSLS